MIVRPCETGDLSAVRDLWNDTIRDSLITFNARLKTLADMEAMLGDRKAQRHGFFVAEDEGRVLGFATYSQFRAGVGYARTMEHSISLAPTARGKGAGRLLMSAIEDHAAKGGTHSMWAGVSSANPGGRDFHAAIGYREVATLKEVGFKWDQWLDLILMQKVLSPASVQS